MSLEDEFKIFKREEKQQFVDIISTQIQYIVERNYVTVPFEEEEEITDEEVRNRVTNDLQALDAMIKLCIAYCKSFGRIDEIFYNISILLNQILFSVGDAGSLGAASQFHIAQLLESIYLRIQAGENTSRRSSVNKCIDQFTGKEFIGNMMSYFLAKALDEDSKNADIKKCFQLKESLKELELSQFEETIVHLDNFKLQDFLFRAYINPQFVLSSHGKKFLIFAFSQLNPHLIVRIHQIIRDQLYLVQEDVLQSYSEIYYKAWKHASGQFKLVLENECIQNLMEAAILSRDKRLFSNIRSLLLMSFESEEKKKLDEVDDMLLRLYEPILFRNLCVANATVRRQSSCLFVDVFPLRNPTADRSESEQLLNRQLNALVDIIEDDVPAVRCVGIQGVCQILKVYWDVVPSDDRYRLLKLVILKYALDSSSSAVRISVLKGINALLDNTLSHLMLKQLLSGGNNQFGKLIHDGVSAVRKEFISLLLHIKTIKSISYIDIVSETDIIRRLCVDSGEVRDQITQLLLNSYFAYDKKGSEQFKRFQQLVASNAIGAKLFYESAVKYVPADACCSFLKTIVRLLNQCCITIRNSNQNENAETVIQDKQPKSKGGKKKKISKNNDIYLDEINKENEIDQENEEPTQLKSKRSNKRRKTQENPSNVDSEKTQNILIQLSQDLPFMESTIEIVSILVEQISSIYSNDENNTIDSIFDSNFLMDLKACFKTNRIQSAIWKICKYLPEKKIVEFSQNCLTSLENMCEEGMIRSDMSNILECIIQWNQTSKLLDFIEEKLHIEREVLRTVPQSTQTRQKRRKVNTQVLNTEDKFTQGFIALHFLNSLLQSEETRNALLKVVKKSYPLKNTYELLKSQISENIQNILTTKDIDRIQEQYYIAAFHTFGKISLHLSTPMYIESSQTSKSAKNKKSTKKTKTSEFNFSETIPEPLKQLLTLCGDQILPIVEIACEDNEKSQVEEVSNAWRRKRKNTEDEISSTEEKNHYFHITVCICRSICMFLNDSIAMGLLRSTQKESIDIISGILFSFLRKSLGIILPFLFGDINKILYTLTNKGWEQETVINFFKELISASAFNIFSENNDKNADVSSRNLKMRKQYLHKLLQTFSSKNLEQHVVFYLFNSCMKEISEQLEENFSTKLYSKSDSNLPPLSSLVVELISESTESIQREILKKIYVSLQKVQSNDSSFEGVQKIDPAFISALQLVSLLTRIAPNQKIIQNPEFHQDIQNQLIETESRISDDLAFEEIRNEIELLRHDVIDSGNAMIEENDIEVASEILA